MARHLLDRDGSFLLRTGSCRNRLDQFVAALNSDDLQPPFLELVEVLATTLPPSVLAATHALPVFTEEEEVHPKLVVLRRTWRECNCPWDKLR